MYAIVMAGGQGTRFWPQSTSKMPKQYLTLVGKESLLVQTLRRFDGLVAMDHRYVVTVHDQVPLLLAQGESHLPGKNIIVEPTGRNTAPCILLALAQLMAGGAQKEEVVAIVPADHVVLNTPAYRRALQDAQILAATHPVIMILGIPPTFPHTGYGYIHQGRLASDTPQAYQVAAFREKPTLEVATQYLQTGEYYWNGGMFVGKIATFLAEFQKCTPQNYDFYPALIEAASRNSAEQIGKIYHEIPAVSIDYAVMEKSAAIWVLRADFDWNDLGSWDALAQVIAPQENNTVVAAQEVFFSQAQGNIIFAPEQFVSLIDVNDLIVIANGRSVVVVPKNQSQKIKLIVENLRQNPVLGAELL